MAKTVKTFNVEKEIYEALIKLFKEYAVSTSVSFFVDQCLNKLLHNLSEVEGVVKKTDYFPDIMKFIIEKSCKELIITTPGTRLIPSGASSMKDITTDPNSSFKYGLYAESEDDRPEEFNYEDLPEGESPEELEGTYWVEEYEAHKQNLPRVFVRLLKTGKFELSRDKRVLMEKETGKRFIDLLGTHVIEIADRAKIIGPNDEK